MRRASATTRPRPCAPVTWRSGESQAAGHARLGKAPVLKGHERSCWNVSDWPLGSASGYDQRVTWRFFQVLSSAALGTYVLASSALCSAHIHLLEPQPRYPDEVSGENKNCPCGVGTAGRSCSKPEERSDPNRSTDRATPLPGGSMLVVRLDEYVGHSGRYRIAFDPDGADLEDFNQHILADIPDPRGKAGNIDAGSLWEIAAALPNIDCDNCTLQVIQMMDGEMENPVADPVGRSSYYQCADLVLTADASKPAGYAEPVLVLGEPTEMDEPEPSEMPEEPMDTPEEPAPRDDEMTPTGPGPMASAGSGGGCSIGVPRRSMAWQPLALVALLLYRWRRRAR